MMLRPLISICFLLTSLTAFGQGDGMRSSGKIYVVVAVLVVIIIGLFFYLARLDKRAKTIEDSIK